METLVRISSSVLLAAGLLAAQTPVAHWSFDSGIAPFLADDETGNGYHLISLRGSSALKLVDGVAGKGLRFAAPAFELEARETGGAFNFSQITLEAIVLNPGADAAILDYETFSPGIARGFWLGIYPSNRLNFTTGNENNEPKWNELLSSAPLVPGKVYHVAAVMNDGGFNKVYIDGQEAGAKPFVPYLPNSGRVKIGYKFGNGAFGGYLASGSLDEIKVYSAALTAAEIDARYQEVKAVIDSVNALP